MSARFLDVLADGLYPAKCALCGALGPSPCAPCAGDFEAHDPGVEFLDCGLLTFRACRYMYRGRATEAVQALKYGRKTSLGQWMAEELAAAAGEFGLDFDVVAPVPIHWSRRAMRGFNQSELLAAKLNPRLDLIARIKKTRSQVGLSRSERLRNLDGAFMASELAAGLRVLLVDDVLTSGQTARECAKALLAAGASEVGVLCFAGEAFHD